ncbi:hypothetical protein CH302_01040 [Rhodococcus sp. 15-2388-1-1a]|uniref:VG15 protein n=1 Tax=Nocardiaceae TaxID=85025 RepID=UPI00069187BF|nr:MULTISPECIES: hypothetical protein [Rhodococcus]OZF05239.1 hypothetical protein CH302_01040 [Rhodococcus sp. 15-2388-1-1a]
MPTSPDDRVVILNEVNTLAVEDFTDMWRRASSADLSSAEFRSTIIDATPQIIDPYAAAAADYGVDWYQESAPDLAYQPVAGPMPDPEKIAGSSEWALNALGGEALGRFAGVVQKAIFDTERDTIVANVEQETGARWVRHARTNACEFCRMLATRSAVYTSEAAATSVVGRGVEMSASDRRARARGESRGDRGRFLAGGRTTRGTRPLGETYHDYCRCTSLEVRPGMTYLPPSYTEKWEQQYIDAVKATADGGAINLKAVLAHMRQSEKAGKAAAATRTAATAAAKQAEELTSWLAAEQAWEATRLVSKATRSTLDAAAASLPKGASGWRSFETLQQSVNGEYIASTELAGHLTTVTGAGRAIRSDVARRLDADTELVELRSLVANATAERERLLSAGNFGDLFAHNTRVDAAKVSIAQRESAAIVEALSDVRQFGGHQQAVHTMTAAERSRLTQLGGRPVSEADADAVALLRDAEKFFPTEWLEAADARGPLALGYVDRGFFLQKAPSTLPTDSVVVSPRGTFSYRTGAHSDEATETMIHELGHRMEQAIPGLTQLEFALARSRATRGGVLEDLVPVSNSQLTELTYKDDWLEPYAGRSYVPAGYSRPDLVAHEVFQVGTQDLYGRSSTKYGDDELQDFMLGVLALL